MKAVMDIDFFEMENKHNPAAELWGLVYSREAYYFFFIIFFLKQPY